MGALGSPIFTHKWVASGIVYSNVVDEDNKNCNPSRSNAVDNYLSNLAREISHARGDLPQVL